MVEAVCGDAIRAWQGENSLWGAHATGSRRVRGTARVMRPRLNRGLAAQTTHCDVGVRRNGRRIAGFEVPVRHVRGVGACRRGADSRILRLAPDQLEERATDGTVHPIAVGPALAAPGFSDDGATVTWLEAGQPRSAPVP